MFKLRVKEVLVEKSISMGKLSREANVPFNLVRRMCKDPNYIPRSDTLSKVARYLKISMDDLYYYDEDLDAGAP
jgi:DNA-binding Xre family transcriptional regulator